MLFIHASVSELHGSMEIKIEKSSYRVVELRRKLNKTAMSAVNPNTKKETLKKI